MCRWLMYMGSPTPVASWLWQDADAAAPREPLEFLRQKPDERVGGFGVGVVCCGVDATAMLSKASDGRHATHAAVLGGRVRVRSRILPAPGLRRQARTDPGRV